MAQGKKRALEIEIHHRVPIRLGGLVDFPGTPSARVQDHDVEPSECRDRAVDGGLHVGVARDVTAERGRPRAARLQSGDGVVQLLRGARHARQRGTFRGERLCDGKAETAARAGHECHLTFELHRSSRWR
jgi:hypothetical protein